jgi:hypothetical protein
LPSVSCGSAGNCAAAGDYTDGSVRTQAFVVSERNGTWHTAIEVPGSGTLNKGAGAATSLSCAPAVNCAVGGFYTDISNHQQALVASERNGAWRRAIEVPGLSARTARGYAAVNAVSCASAGNCAAGGDYSGSFTSQQAFVASEINGTWHTAIEVPGSGALGTFASVNAVSCASAGNCAAGGTYTDGSSSFHAFVASEQNGTWHTAIEVPGLRTLNAGRYALVWEVSCASAGNCAAGGTYRDGHGHQQAFVVSEINGTWHTAIKVPGSGILNAGGDAHAFSVSCAAAGNCAVSGRYTDGHGHQQAFVASERNGAWGKAIEVPGSGILNAGGTASVNSVSCASAGNCAAGGTYTDSSGHQQAFVVGQA